MLDDLFPDGPPDRDDYVMRYAIRVNPEQWRKRLPDPSWWPNRLEACPLVRGWPTIDRRSMFELADHADTQSGRRDLLVAAVAWGTGTRTLPLAWRVRTFTKNTPEWIDERFSYALRVLHAGDPVDAYLVMNELSKRIKHLGPAFFTKALYFAAGPDPSGPVRPLILDRNVVLALNVLAPHLDLHPGRRWTADQYGTYLELAHKWADRFCTAPDVVERRLFELGKQPNY